MRVVGIDPGTSGGIAILHNRDVLLLEDLPVHRLGVAGKKALRAELDLHTLHAMLAEHAPYDHAWIEQVGPMPGQGVTSMFRFGFACGAITGLITALGAPLSMVRPQVWQKHHGSGPAPDAARQRAARLYPAVADNLARKRDANRADALLIAAFGLSRLAAATPQSPG